MNANGVQNANAVKENEQMSRVLSPTEQGGSETGKRLKNTDGPARESTYLTATPL